MSLLDVRNELIQVAAVAISAVQAIDTGSSNGKDLEVITGLFHDVDLEILRQYDKWGERTHTIFEWLSILTEEVGEACMAANDTFLGG